MPALCFYVLYQLHILCCVDIIIGDNVDIVAKVGKEVKNWIK